jgi:hypothetical protein
MMSSRWRRCWAELAAGNDIVGFECREVCADGSVRWFEWSTSSRPEDGVVYGMARDVTERRMANAELGGLHRVATLAAEGVAPAESNGGRSIERGQNACRSRVLSPSSLLRAVALARIDFVLFCSQICLHITAMADPLGTSAITVT